MSQKLPPQQSDPMGLENQRTKLAKAYVDSNKFVFFLYCYKHVLMYTGSSPVYTLPKFVFFVPDPMRGRHRYSKSKAIATKHRGWIINFKMFPSGSVGTMSRFQNGGHDSMAISNFSPFRNPSKTIKFGQNVIKKEKKQHLNDIKMLRLAK